MPLEREDLLRMAREVHAAATAHDARHLEQLARRLLDALVTHREAEAVAMIRLLPAEARMLKRGQRRVSAATETMIALAARGCSGTPEQCAARTEELLAFLVLQFLDERLAGCDPAA